jgi:hypothetical protein
LYENDSWLTALEAVAYIGFHFGEGRLCIWFLGGREGKNTLLRKNYFNTIRLLDSLYTIRKIRNSIFLMVYYFLKV